MKRSKPRKIQQTIIHIGLIGIGIVGSFKIYLAAYYMFGGWYVCDDWDLKWHLSPCERVLDNEYTRWVAFAPDSRQLVVHSYSKPSITIWDTITGTRVMTVPYQLDSPPFQSRFSPDSKLLGTIGLHGLQLVDLQSQQIRYTIPSPEIERSSLAFSPDGKWLAWSHATFATDWNPPMQIQIIRVADGMVVQTLPTVWHTRYYSLRFTPDSQHLLSWNDQGLQLWDLNKQEITYTHPGFDQLSPDGRLWSGAEATNQKIEILQLNAAQNAYEPMQPPHYEHTPQCKRGSNIALFPQGDRAISVTDSYDDLFFPSISATTCVYSIENGTIIWQSHAQGKCVAVAPNETVVAVCTGSVQIWRIPTTWRK